MIHVGTSGFGYHDWTPTFYPPGLVYEDYLSYYSERFTCCEWWNKDGASRYDYNYRRRELLGWIPRLREIARQSEVTFVIFNNHWRGQSVNNALAFREILERSRSVKSGRRAATRRAG